MTSIDQIKEEFARHVSSAAAAVKFSPTPQAGRDFSALVRELEHKRQLGQLTAIEQEQLREADRLMGNISYYNQQTASNAAIPETATANIYELQNSRLNPEQAPPPKFTMPRISEAEADQIISVINQQFEEKVLRSLRAKGIQDSAQPPTVQDYMLKLKEQYARS